MTRQGKAVGHMLYKIHPSWDGGTQHTDTQTMKGRNSFLFMAANERRREGCHAGTIGGCTGTESLQAGAGLGNLRMASEVCFEGLLSLANLNSYEGSWA